MKLMMVAFTTFLSLSTFATPDAFLFGSCMTSLQEEYADSPELDVASFVIVSDSEFYATIGYIIEDSTSGEIQCYQSAVIVKDCELLSKTQIECE